MEYNITFLELCEVLSKQLPEIECSYRISEIALAVERALNIDLIPF